MKTFYWLLKREYWEHRGGFLWAPIIAGGILLLLQLLLVGVMGSLFARHGGGYNVNDIVEKMAKGNWDDAGNLFELCILMPMIVLNAVLGFVVMFYGLGTIYNERRDRSILFWKSLPISDSRTVLSKLVSAVVVAPIITSFICVGLGIVSALIYAIPLGLGGADFGKLLAHTHIVSMLLGLLALVPLYALWALPAVGWFMLCSAWSRSVPFLWGVAVPLIAALVLWMFNQMAPFDIPVGWICQNIIFRVLVSVFPVSLLIASGHSQGSDPVAIILSNYAMLGSLKLWLGAAAGAAMIATAIWLRRTRDDA
ncbi:hypothetical protein [Dyella sp.]|uniref:hypothetical protein n=1 Tax=Dyella sp. TaxID=1869338 RepID=UPI002ED12FA6